MKITRRNILKAFGGLSFGSLLPFAGTGCSNERSSDTGKKYIKTDILVVGGGPAGITAALQSASAGCSTILVEFISQLGGTTTTGGVAFPGLFHAWGKQVISGLGWELVKETVKLNGNKLPDFAIPTGRNHFKHQVIINPYLYAMLAEEKCIDAGVHLRYYETPVSTLFNGNEWEVDVVGKGTQVRIVCKQIIDCTGNAAVTSLAGFNLLREDVIQPGTLMYSMGGYDYDSLDIDLYKKKYKEALSGGVFEEHMFFGGIERVLFGSHLSRERNMSHNHIAGADSTTSETHTSTNIKARSGALKMLRFIKGLPGGEHTYIDRMCAETAIRETFRVDGLHRITKEEYITGKVFDDAIAYTFYPIDVHDENGVAPKQLVEGIVPTIPLSALIPKNSKNFLVAGRCVSSDRKANSALRVQASCMAMGQAAGAAAAMAVRTNKDILEIPINDIKQLIAENGGIVPGSNA